MTGEIGVDVEVVDGAVLDVVAVAALFSPEIAKTENPGDVASK